MAEAPRLSAFRPSARVSLAWESLHHALRPADNLKIRFYLQLTHVSSNTLFENEFLRFLYPISRNFINTEVT